MTTSTTLASKSQIVDYWSKHRDESDLAIDWADALTHCWRCGHKKSDLQRCHVIPAMLEGSGRPENLILLCIACHNEAPDVADPEFIWRWIAAHKTPFYNTYWIIRGFEEYERVYGETIPFAFPPFKPRPDLPSAWRNADDIDEASISLIVKKVTEACGYHSTSGYVIRPATRAWMLRQVLRELGLVRDPLV